jgi:hypothetical protein
MHHAGDPWPHLVLQAISWGFQVSLTIYEMACRLSGYVGVPRHPLSAFSVLAAYATTLVDVNEQGCVDHTAFVET